MRNAGKKGKILLKIKERQVITLDVNISLIGCKNFHSLHFADFYAILTQTHNLVEIGIFGGRFIDTYIFLPFLFMLFGF